MSSGPRVSIPGGVRKIIQNIKEIAGNHSEEEIYAMLKDCSMDPNETVQKLLFQDPFHEVKRRPYRRKESLSNKESLESRWRPGTQGRGSRIGRMNHSTRYIANDTSSGRSSGPGKENEFNQVSEKNIGHSSSPTSQETKKKEISSATGSLALETNGLASVASGNTGFHAAPLSPGSLVDQPIEVSAVDISKSGGPPTLPHPVEAMERPNSDFETEDTCGQLTLSSSNNSSAGTQSQSPGVYFSASDPVLVPSHDSRLPGAVGTIKREVGSQRIPCEQISAAPSEGKSTPASEVPSFSMQGKMSSRAPGVGKNQLSDSIQPASSSHASSAVIRPSFNCNSRSQVATGPSKVGPSKEWKPKPTNLNLAQGSETSGSSEVLPITVEANTQSVTASSVLDSKEPTSKLQRKLEEIHISDGQHVIIPNHLHVPEAEKFGFCFGSFDTGFGFNTGCNNAPENDRNPTPFSETSESVEETAEQSSNQNALTTTEEGDYPDHPQSPRHVPENLSSGDSDVSSTVVPQSNESKQEAALPPGSEQYSIVHTSPSYSFGFVPPMVGSQLAPFENSESQARDVSRLPSFVVPQPFDPSSYYAQFYRSGADSDGRISPFHSPGVATKYTGNIAALSSQTSQSAQEGGNSLVLSTAVPTPMVTQAAGVMQSSIALTQQPLPVFRQPTGMPIPHYPPNYFPYGHYFSPIFVPPPAVHQFLSNGTFSQQPQAGSIYPAPPGATAKYSLSQYKVGTNTVNSTHVGVPSSYGLYGSSAVYNPNSSSTSGNSTANEDLTTPQFKESNVYITGQQSEGSAVWITAPGRDVSGLQASSFYNIPPQGQVAFAPTQAGHGTFAGIYHPAQAVSASTVHPLLQQSQTMAAAGDIVGPTTSVYQQPQNAQINWPNSY